MKHYTEYYKCRTTQSVTRLLCDSPASLCISSLVVRLRLTNQHILTKIFSCAKKMVEFNNTTGNCALLMIIVSQQTQHLKQRRPNTAVDRPHL